MLVQCPGDVVCHELDLDVVADAAVDHVDAATADQDIIACTAEQHVVAFAADQHVIVVAAIGGELDRAEPKP